MVYLVSVFSYYTQFPDENQDLSAFPSLFSANFFVHNAESAVFSHFFWQNT